MSKEEYGIKNAITTIILMIIVVFSIIYFSRSCDRLNNEYNKTKVECQQMIGKKISLEKDTFMIVNYSIFNETCLLSNGREIKLELAKKLEIK